MALTHALYTPGELMRQIADDARRLRLAQDLSRATLATRSGVPAPTIKRFETTGRISLESLVLLAGALGAGDRLHTLFAPPPPDSLEQLKRGPRQRGRK